MKVENSKLILSKENYPKISCKRLKSLQALHTVLTTCSSRAKSTVHTPTSMKLEAHAASTEFALLLSHSRFRLR